MMNPEHSRRETNDEDDIDSDQRSIDECLKDTDEFQKWVHQVSKSTLEKYLYIIFLHL